MFYSMANPDPQGFSSPKRLFVYYLLIAVYFIKIYITFLGCFGSLILWCFVFVCVFGLLVWLCGRSIENVF